jgi:hypothetical protein
MRSFLRRAMTGLLAVTLFATLASQASSAASSAGSAGTNTALPDTDSAVTVKGRGEYASLTIKVNQTKSLTSQAVSLTWTGGTPTAPVGRFFENYLQVMQCWGEDDGTHPENPGPPPEQCVAGATTGSFGIGSQSHPGASEAISRIVSFNSWPNAETSSGYRDPKNGFIWRSFRSVDGTTVNAQYDTDFNPSVSGGNYWLNPYFDINTTNELAGARTRPNGTGSDLFTVNTGAESSGLGCGQKLVPPGGGALFTPKCWLVVVPRGSALTENLDTPYEQNAATFGVMTSPLSDSAWKNRIAVPLEFNPVDSACALGSDERRIGGNELVSAAIASWQPALCATPGRPPYSYVSLSDANARDEIISPSVGAPGMAVVAAPADKSVVDPKSPPVYAPLALSGIVIGFNVERSPLPSAGQDSQDLSGVRVADLNLTPRLVAKLLTQSYRQQVDIATVKSPYAWVRTNPTNLGRDPDFEQFNPEFATLQIGYGRNFSGLLAPGRNSDTAKQVWEWILADPEAKAWLDGKPDQWGMVVNPVYATTAAANVNGVPFGDPVPNSFPKADPYCLKLPPQGSLIPPPLCSTDWMPFTQSFRDGARLARAGDDGARIGQNPFASTSDQFWSRGGPQTLGSRAMMTVTDTVSAAKYGLQSAHLARAGDDGVQRTFLAPDAKGLVAGVKGMAAKDEPTVLEPDPTAAVPSGYPLTTLSYAMIRPLALDSAARADYADFLDYAAGAGQVAGLDPGQLPLGYAPLPSDLKASAVAAAKTVREMQAPADPSPSSSDTVDQSSSGSTSALQTTQRRSSSAASSSPAADDPTPAAVTDVAASTPQDAGPLTPILALARSRFFIPALGVLLILACLGALEITKRPRRGRVGSGRPDKELIP